MSLNDEKLILGDKTRKQILNDAENRFIEIVLGYAFGFTAIILLIIFSRSEINELYGILILLVCVLTALILHILGRRCEFCDSLKSNEHYEMAGFTAAKSSLRCSKCNLSSKQIKEIIDLLERGIEVNKETIARFNRREI